MFQLGLNYLIWSDLVAITGFLARKVFWESLDYFSKLQANENIREGFPL